MSGSDGAITVVDFSTTWCGPCVKVAPEFEALSERIEGVKFLKCIGDVTPEAGALMKREGVRSVPCFHIWKEGKKIDVVNGTRLDEVESALKSLM